MTAGRPADVAARLAVRAAEATWIGVCVKVVEGPDHFLAAAWAPGEPRSRWPDAVVIGPVIVGPGVEIGADAVVNESILWRGAKVGNGALVEQTVMAADSMVAGNVEVRGAIVVEKNLSAAERQSLGGSMDFGSADIPVKERWWRRVWSGFRSTVRAVGLDRAAAVLPTTAPTRQAV